MGLGSTKEMFIIENEMFETVREMYEAKAAWDKRTYRLYLDLLEELNSEYEALTGKPCYPPTKMVEFYETLWKF